MRNKTACILFYPHLLLSLKQDLFSDLSLVRKYELNGHISGPVQPLFVPSSKYGRATCYVPVDFASSSVRMVLGSTQPLTEMSTRNVPGGKGRQARKADSLAAIYEPIV
jgi:hypothetical protein